MPFPLRVGGITHICFASKSFRGVDTATPKSKEEVPTSEIIVQWPTSVKIARLTQAAVRMGKAVCSIARNGTVRPACMQKHATSPA